MAKQPNLRNISTNVLFRGMNKDSDPMFLQEGEYTHAVNAKLTNIEGDSYLIQNEPSFKECITLTYDFISSSPLGGDRHVVFSGDGTESEIGIADLRSCTYTVVMRDPCLNLTKKFPPKAISQVVRNTDEVLYIVDGNNPNRYLNLNNVPDNCEDLRLNPLIQIPVAKISLSEAGGKLPNGSYQVAMAYSEENQRVTDIYAKTVPVGIYSHQNFGGGVKVEFTDLDKDFKEYKVYLIATVNSATTVYEIGDYDTDQDTVYIGNINDKPTIPLGDVYIKSVVYDVSRDIVSTDDRALFTGAKTKKKFNYQPLASQIRVKWVAKAVPSSYYKEGGIDVGYMRDEVYGLGIEWLYDTGEYTDASVLVPQLPSASDSRIINNSDVYESYDPGCDDPEPKKYYEIYNTSNGGVSTSPLGDCVEKIIGTGTPGLYVSKALYPDNEEVFGTDAGEPIRLFRMPDVCKVPYNVGEHKVILGLQLENIQHPVDENGNKIPNIVGYRIVRTDRTNHKSIQGKGLLFNMGEYELQKTDTVYENVLYPNYPFNDLRDDQFLSRELIKANDERNWRPASSFKNDMFTFHSPSFSGFTAKFTFGNELRLEGEMSGTCSTEFSETYKHPKNVLSTNTALAIAYIIGVGGALLESNEKRCAKLVAEAAGPIGSTVTLAWNTYEAALKVAELLPSPAKETAIASARTTLEAAINAAAFTNASVAGSNPNPGTKLTFEEEICETAFTKIPSILKGLQNIALFTYHFTNYANQAFDTIRNFSKPQQYVLQANSLGTYRNISCVSQGNTRRRITEAKYIYPQLQTFQNQKLNNWKRESGVALSISRQVSNTSTQDTSRQTMDQAGACSTRRYDSTVCSYLASIRRKLPSQYGSVESFKFLSTGYEVTSLPENTDVYSTEEIFGGDTYLNSFTLKRKMQYFTDTAFDVPDDYSFNYENYTNIPYPRFWMNTFKYDIADIVSFDFDGVPNLPSALHNLDCESSGIFVKKNAYMYLSNNGIVDVTLESEFNLDYRDYSDLEGWRHYTEDEHTDLDYIFRQDFSDIDNEYNYDPSYSKELEENFISNFDTEFSATIPSKVFTDYSNRVFWSLPYLEGFTYDTWRTTLTGNYYDFPREAGNLLSTRPLDRNNLVFIFDKSAPWYITAQDTLQTDAGQKVTIGDGGIFAQAPRPLIYTDTLYGAGSSSTAITNTQFGLFYPAENGRVYQMIGTKLEEINSKGISFWLKENMPFNIQKDFTEKISTDNPLTGPGFLSVFDNTDETYFITKKDYRLSEEFRGSVTYVDEEFILNGEVIDVTDLTYFEDCSWTLSYHPKLGAWVSYHDWIPDATIQTSTVAYSVKGNTIYKHNDECESYCYFYGTQYPFDIEYVINNGPNTSTLSSVEYSIECYKYFNECRDKHHLLDYNFNKAFIYNTEQVSGILNLNLVVKNDISKRRFYPQVNTDSIDIEFSKEEQRYRFNQFWDITRNRAEFNSDYVNLLTTNSNGYKYAPNDAYINYQKPIRERKKMRHNWFKVYLSRVDQPQQMNKIIVKHLANKQIYSPR